MASGENFGYVGFPSDLTHISFAVFHIAMQYVSVFLILSTGKKKILAAKTSWETPEMFQIWEREIRLRAGFWQLCEAAPAQKAEYNLVDRLDGVITMQIKSPLSYKASRSFQGKAA